MEIQKATCHKGCYDLVATVDDKPYLIQFAHSPLTGWSYIECRDGLCEETVDGGPHVTLSAAVDHALMHEED